MRFGIDLTACWRPRVGMVTASVELARALLEAGRQHDWVIFGSREPLPSLPAEWVLSPHRQEVANKLLWLPGAEVRPGLDAILYPYWPSPPLRRPAAPPAVVAVHDLAFRLRPREVPWQQRLYLGRLLPRALRTAARVIVPSAATRADLARLFPAWAGKVAVVPEGPTPLPPAGRLPDGLKPGFVLAVGTLEDRKNYGRLAQAYARLENPPPLVIAGRPGWNGAPPPSGPGIRVLGHVGDAELAALYEAAAVLAFPSLYEGFGLPLLDAMKRGLPALVSDGGALPELAGDAALAVDPEDVAAIAAGLRRLLEDEALRERLGGEGRRRAVEFSWDRAGEAVLGILVEATRYDR